MSTKNSPIDIDKPHSKSQLFFIKFTLAVLVDLVVLGFFNEYWDCGNRFF